MTACESTAHATDVQVEAVARIHLKEMPETGGFAVCPEHLVAYVQGVYLDSRNDLRLAFAVEPA